MFRLAWNFFFFSQSPCFRDLSEFLDTFLKFLGAFEIFRALFGLFGHRKQPNFLGSD